MPLADGYEAERLLKLETTAIGQGITEHLIEIEKVQEWDFILIVVDRTNGIMQYMSDMPKEEANMCMKAYIARSEI